MVKRDLDRFNVVANLRDKHNESIRKASKSRSPTR